MPHLFDNQGEIQLNGWVIYAFILVLHFKLIFHESERTYCYLFRTFKKVATFHEYVRPVQHPNLTHFCTDLTGIVQETVENADDFVQVFARFQAWLEDNQFDHDGGEDAFLTMGDWDFKTMLPSQVEPKMQFSFHLYFRIQSVSRTS